MSSIVKTFHVPVRPYSPIDALNRRAAALGSPRYAELASHANYNGHHVAVNWNDYRQYYIAQYYWGGRVVLDRGTFADCLRAALREFNRGALGASVSVTPREDDQEALELCWCTPDLAEGDLDFSKPEPATWWTWRHQAAVESARDSANPRMMVRVFDWELMQAATDLAAYENAVKTKHGRIWT
jgi:hypothetical protein